MALCRELMAPHRLPKLGIVLTSAARRGGFVLAWLVTLRSLPGTSRPGRPGKRLRSLLSHPFSRAQAQTATVSTARR